jgi:hypothetical protein
MFSLEVNFFWDTPYKLGINPLILHASSLFLVVWLNIPSVRQTVSSVRLPFASVCVLSINNINGHGHGTSFSLGFMKN